MRSTVGVHPNVGTLLNKSHSAITGARMQRKRPAYIYVQKILKNHWIEEKKPSDKAEATNSLTVEYVLLLSSEYSILN